MHGIACWNIAPRLSVTSLSRYLLPASHNLNHWPTEAERGRERETEGHNELDKQIHECVKKLRLNMLWIVELVPLLELLFKQF